MTISITQNTEPQELTDAIQKMPSKETKFFDAYKYLGKLKRGLDGIAYQKEQRNEWN